MDSEPGSLDSVHIKSLVGFAFSYLLEFKLLPRMKRNAHQKLVKADADDQVPSCLSGMVADKPIDWEIIAQQYDQMVKYATALRLGTAEAEQVLRRFTRGGPKHPHLQGHRGTRQGGQERVRRRVRRRLRAAPRDPRGPAGRGELELRQHRPVLRQRRHHPRQRQGASGGLHAQPAPAAVRAGHQHPAPASRPTRFGLGGQAHRRRRARPITAVLGPGQPLRPIPPRHGQPSRSRGQRVAIAR
ncbi:hypothetical protein E1294_42240 [Nonomuraea diastatica]|uniref:Tn3 transposase DDE domain-containing protein n=1 Tax=Nonomuraea diastatica TaxID=1848329 RepID=A0A4R4W589_9ACTN|nr:hypothetical protein E1294_42240 [Nonomuraea diastatica]